MTDLVSRLGDEERRAAEAELRSVSPDDGKYSKTSKKLSPYLSADAEWRAFAHVQMVLLETRVEFGQADRRHLDEVKDAIGKISPLNMALLEETVTRHDQLAVLEEIGRFVSPETKALLHPGTTSYDVVDTARSYLLQRCWQEAFRPKVAETIDKLCGLAETYIDVLQAGRTHLQITSPVSFGASLAGYAARLADRVEKCDAAFADLRGKISGIVGTGASIEMVIGRGRAIEFERAVLEKLDLKADTTSSQIVQKERLCDVGNGIVTLMHVLGDFANDMRILYSSDIGEVTSRDAAARLAGSSADAGKNNPINWENIAGKVAVVESGMRVLYAMIATDLQRDLRSSVQARYQPAQMIVETYESFCRASKALDQLSPNVDVMASKLEAVRQFPSEAMVAITRAHGWTHPVHGVGHDTVATYSRKAKREKRPLLDVALEDMAFSAFFKTLADGEQRILRGDLDLYLGHAKERAAMNISYARSVMTIK